MSLASGLFGSIRRLDSRIGLGMKSVAHRFGGAQSRGFSVLRWGKINFGSKVGDGSNSDIVAAVVGWIMRAFPEAPIVVYRVEPDGTSNRNPAHPMLARIRRPNPYYTMETLLQATIADYNITGNAYWRKVRSGNGGVLELWWIPSSLIEPESDDKNQYLTHYTYTVGGKRDRIDPTDIVHFRFGLDPVNPRKGRSLLSTALREIFTDDQAAEFSGTLLANLGVPGVVIAPTGNSEIPEGSAVELKTNWASKFGGDKRGEPLVMTVPSDVHILTFSPEQMNLTELRRLPEERISAIFGIGAIVAGLGAGLDRSTYSNFEEARKAAYEQNIKPTQRAFAETIGLQLMPDFGDPDRDLAAFDNSQVAIYRENETALYQRADVGIRGGWLTVGDGLRLVGRQAEPRHEYYLRQPTLLPVPEATAGEPSALNDAAVASQGEALKAAIRPIVAELVSEIPRDAVQVNGHSDTLVPSA